MAGYDLTVIDRDKELLPFVDREIMDALVYHLRGSRATVWLGETVDAVFNYPTLAECYKTAAFDGVNRLGG